MDQEYEAVNRFNKEWKEKFQRERVEMITNDPVEAVKFLEKGKLLTIKWMDIECGYRDWQASFLYEGVRINFTDLEDGDFRSDTLNFCDESVDVIYYFFEELKIVEVLNQVSIERKEEERKVRERSHVGLNVKKIYDGEDNEVVYVLENGDKLRVKVDF